MPEKLPPQITDVKKGDTLEFIRKTFDGTVYLAVGKKVRAYVVSVSPSSAILAFSRERRNIHNQPTGIGSYSYGCFRYCRIVDKELLIANCRKVEDKA